jgi:DNA invertase Pin-like site-specific DNA recombinase
MSGPKPLRAALYLRVSTDEQTAANQRPDVERLTASRGLAIVETYEETASAAKKRPVFERMMADAKARRFDVLVVWALDRFGRSMAGNVADALALDKAGVKLISVREPWLDTGGPVRDLLLAIFSWVAQEERNRLIERTKAGLARVRERGSKSGKPIGRPRRLDGATVAAVAKLAAEGRSSRAIAVALKLPRTTVRRALAGQNPRSGEPLSRPRNSTPKPGSARS